MLVTCGRPAEAGRVNPRALAVAKLLRALKEGPQTYRDLCDFAGMASGAAGRYVNALHDEKLVHIAEWRKDAAGRRTLAAFAWDPGAPDAPRPFYSAAEKSRRFRADAAYHHAFEDTA